MRELTNQFPDDIVLHCCDGAVWHQSNMLDIPENIVLFLFPVFFLPCTLALLSSFLVERAFAKHLPEEAQ